MPDHASPPVPACCTFSDLRRRAFEKADTGNYASWREAAAAVEFEGCPGAVNRLSSDPKLTELISARCEQATDGPG